MQTVHFNSTKCKNFLFSVGDWNSFRFQTWRTVTNSPVKSEVLTILYLRSHLDIQISWKKKDKNNRNQRNKQRNEAWCAQSLVGNSKEIIHGPEENECHSNYSLLKLAQVLACDLHFTKMTTPFSLLCFSVPFP